MFETIIEASKNFCIHQIREQFSTAKKDLSPAGNYIKTYIDVIMQEEKYRIFFFFNIEIAQKIAYIFLEETITDQETLEDMALESTNLIVGSAKVIAQEKYNTNFLIQTPYLNQEIKQFLSNDYLTISIENAIFTIYLEKIEK